MLYIAVYISHPFEASKRETLLAVETKMTIAAAASATQKQSELHAGEHVVSKR